MNRLMMATMVGAVFAAARGDRAGGGGGRQQEQQRPPQSPPPAAQSASTALTTIDYAADAGAGQEGADNDSFAIPFLVVLQANSPQVDSDKPVEGAKAGMFLNSVTNELFPKVGFIHCAFQRRWVRWGAREAGGGFKGEFTPAQVNELRAGNKVVELDGRFYFPAPDGSVNPDKNDRLSDTRNHFGLLVPDGAAEMGVRVVFALASTGIKVSKNLMSRIDAKKIKVGDKTLAAPSFSSVYLVTTERKENEKGKWHQPKIDMLGEVTNPALYAQAKAFNKLVLEGRARAAHETAQDPAAGGGGGEDSDKF